MSYIHHGYAALSYFFILSVSLCFIIYHFFEWTIPAFAFPAEAGTHLPIPEGWKAELALGQSNNVMWPRLGAN